MTLMQPPIYQCHEGHTICESCWREVQVCPTCRDQLGERPIRNRALEKAAAKLQVDCPHEGCSERPKYENFPAHTAECEWRPLRCMDCEGFEGSVNELVRHMQNVHEVEVNTFDGSQVQTFTGGNGKTGNWTALYKGAEGTALADQYFSVEIREFSSDKSAMQFQVLQMCQGNQPIVEYRLAVVGKGRKTSAEGQVNDYRHWHNVEDSNDCLVVPTSWLYWLSDDDDATFSLKVDLGLDDHWN